MSGLGPVSRDILALVNDTDGYVKIRSIKVLLNNHHNLSRSEHWYRTRLTALAFEGHIEGTTFRVGDRLFLRYRRLPEAE